TPDAQTNAEADTVSLQIQASDQDGDTLTYAAANLPAGLDINTATGLITGTIDYAAQRTYTVMVSADDRKNVPASTSSSWTVTGTHQAPVAVNDSAIAAEDSNANTIGVLANDTDADHDLLVIASVTQGAHGSVAIAPDGLSLTYTPAANYNGPDSFT